MSEKIRISIVMPVYNSEKYLEEAIESVRKQSFQQWELIIVDDCSQDRSRDILNKYEQLDDRINVVFLEKNSGAAIARSEGIKRALGKYLAFLDSDDIWDRNKLHVQLEFMEKNQYAFTYTSYQIMDKDGKKLNHMVKVIERLDYQNALTKTVIWTSTVMIDLQQIGKFEMPNLRAAQDTATWLKILKKVPYAYGLDQITAYYRQVPGSISSSWKRRLRRQWNVYRMSEGFSVVRSVLLYGQYVNYVLHKRIKEE